MPRWLLRLPARCCIAVHRGILRIVRTTKHTALTVVHSKGSQQLATIVQKGFESAVPKLYYAAGALVGTLEGLWLEGRAYMHEHFEADEASHKAWMSPIRYSYYDFRPAAPVNPFILFNNGGQSKWPLVRTPSVDSMNGSHHSPHTPTN